MGNTVYLRQKWSYEMKYLQVLLIFGFISTLAPLLRATEMPRFENLVDADMSLLQEAYVVLFGPKDAPVVYERHRTATGQQLRDDLRAQAVNRFLEGKDADGILCACMDIYLLCPDANELGALGIEFLIPH